MSFVFVATFFRCSACPEFPHINFLKADVVGDVVAAEVYIVQNLYDAAQIKVNNVFDETRGADLSRDQWRYLLQLGEKVKATLMNTSWVGQIDKIVFVVHAT